MELTQLRYFVTVAETLSFTEAAVRLHVSQPALSYQIKRLENELGARLFERTSRRVSLTLDGRTFLPLSQSVLAKADEAVSVMEERLGVETGQVNMGCIPSAGAYIVPPVLAAFQRSYPGITVLLFEAGGNLLERSVLDGDSDFAIVATPGSPENLEVTPLLAEEILLVVPQHHQLAERRNVSMRELRHERFIVLGGSFVLGAQFVEACRRAGFEPTVAYETGTLESVKSFVRHDLGIAALPRLAMQGPADDTLVSIPFREPFTREINLIKARDRYTTVATRALMVHVRTMVLSTFAGVGNPLPVS